MGVKSIIRTVKVSAKTVIKKDEEGKEQPVHYYLVAIPKEIAEALNIKPKETLLVRILTTTINGKDITGIFYYRP